jgi:CheY-like chemotaxis protein
LRRAFEKLASLYGSKYNAYPRRPLILIAGEAPSTMAISAAFELIRDHCLQANSLNDALGKLILSPAACIIDVTSWEVGWTLIERLRSREALKQTPVFVISSKDLTDYQQQQIKQFGVEKGIVKPFNSTTVRRQVVDAILRDALKRGKPLDSMAS